MDFFRFFDDWKVCANDLAACANDLAACANDWVMCANDWVMCANDWAACAHDWAACANDWATCANDRTACANDWATGKKVFERSPCIRKTHRNSGKEIAVSTKAENGQGTDCFLKRVDIQKTLYKFS